MEPAQGYRRESEDPATTLLPADTSQGSAPTPHSPSLFSADGVETRTCCFSIRSRNCCCSCFCRSFRWCVASLSTADEVRLLHERTAGTRAPEQQPRLLGAHARLAGSEGLSGGSPRDIGRGRRGKEGDLGRIPGAAVLVRLYHSMAWSGRGGRLL